MNYTIENILKTYTNKDKYNKGLYLKKLSLLEQTYSSKDKDNYIFYGTSVDELTRRNSTCMININLKTQRIENYSCDCLGEFRKNTELCHHIVGVVLSELYKEEKDTYKPEDIINPSIKLEILNIYNDYVNVGIKSDFIKENEFKNILSSYRKNNKLYRLEDGNYIDLTDENLIKALNIIQTLNIFEDFDNIQISNEKLHIIDEIMKEEDLFVQNENNKKEIIKRLENLSYDNLNQPEGLNAKLRDYQLIGMNYLNQMSNIGLGAILADEMGLGKTIQVISFLLHKQGTKSIIIAPTSLIYNWENEIKKFASDLRVGILYKSNKDTVINNIDDYDVILTTYNTFKNEMENIKNTQFDYCIIDEAQMIKNHKSQIAQGVKQVNAKVRFALTGTPIENNLLELWSIFDYINQGYLYTKEEFSNIFMENNQNINNLKKLISPFMLRRTKEEVLKELPDKIETKYFVELNKTHKAVYNSYIKLVKKKLKEEGNSANALNYLIKLRQLCLIPELMVKNYEVENSKLKILINILKENKEKKILVFSQFTKVLEVIKNNLENEDISYMYLDGKTPSKERINLVKEYNESTDNQVFLISLKAGGTGLNLTSASLVIHFDPWFNPSIENQANDRAHRIGQKNTVNVIKLIAKDTVEERVISLQETKKELIKNVLDDNENLTEVLKGIKINEIIDLI